MAEGLASLLEEFRTLTNSGISDSAIPSTERYGREYLSDQGHPGNDNSSEKDGYFQPSLLTGMHALRAFYQDVAICNRYELLLCYEHWGKIDTGGYSY